MQEVTIRIRFTQPCLGQLRRQTRRNNTVYTMPRDHEGRVTFMPSWWRAGMLYAAKVRCMAHHEVRSIAWSAAIDGRTYHWRRDVPGAQRGDRRPYALHEVFRVGDTVGVTAVLPNGLTIDTFEELLQVMGTYRGISPFRSDDDDFGKFDVVSVRPVCRRLQRGETDSPPAGDPDRYRGSGLDRDTGTSTGVGSALPVVRSQENNPGE